MKRIVFMGTPDFAVPVLNKLIASDHDVVLVTTQPDRPTGRKKIMTPPPVKEAAENNDIPVFQPEQIRDDYGMILSYHPDIIVTAAYGQILPKELLYEPPFGCINVHASLLPELRGGAPIHMALLEGKSETGVTIMYMTEQLDAGDILASRKTVIEDDDHVGTLHDRLSRIGAELLSDTLPGLFAGEIEPVEQNHDAATFAYNLQREQEKIDWSRSSGDIYNHIRGLHPWPVAFTTYGGKPMKIWWGLQDKETYKGDPGEIVRIDDDAFTVACGDHRGLRITEIQPSGKKRMLVHDFLQGAGNQLKTGERLGD